MTQPESVLDKYRHINVDHDWWDAVYSLWEEKLELLGYHDIQINFSGFYSQGDGASFTGRIHSRKAAQFMEQHDLAVKYPHVYALAGQHYVSLRLQRNSHHYYHENTVSADGEMDTVYEPDDDSDLRDVALFEIYQKAEHEFQSFVEDFEQISRDYMQKIYADLEVDYDYLTSDEAVRESLSINDIH